MAPFPPALYAPSSSARRAATDWEALGREAILDLLGERFAVPWSEVEARVANRGWKEFRKVQPVQLSAARRQLRDEGLIIEEASKHAQPVRFIRLPYEPCRIRERQRLVGRKRKLYRKYLSWAADHLVTL